ncbi:MAG: hypothetical protein KDJ62_03550 [Rhodobiaceae bacterium]|nr:hypothetical protein [Rhodobiaceae bacterium]MCC0049174.1 hypothetical protein [Rhodobiaceae bacterium]
MKSSALLSALLAVAAVSTASAHELESLPHVHPHPDWDLALGLVAIIGGVAGVIFIARKAAAKAKGRRS